MNNLNIEKMSLADLDSISNILKSDFDDFWNENILKKELQNPNSIYIVGKLGSEIVGFAGITVILDTAELNYIVIKKSYRGNKFSSALLENLINIATEKKCKQINLEVSFKNTVAINLYEKFGFKQVGLRKKYYKDQDAILFTKIL